MRPHKTLIVTAYNDKLKAQYAYHFLDSYQGDLDVKVYSETPLEERTQLLHTHRNFEQRHRHRPTRSYKHDAVRFCYKVYAIAQALDEFAHSYSRILWLDADTRFYKQIDEQWVDGHIHTRQAVFHYMGRPNTHSETGVMLFDLRHRTTRPFVQRAKHYYDSDNIFLLKEWHDAYVWDTVRQEYPRELMHNLNENNYSAPGAHIQKHLFGEWFEHKKGKRKHDKT